MPLHLSILLGLILAIVIIVFWWLIELDTENQKNQKIFSHSKNKARKHTE